MIVLLIYCLDIILCIFDGRLNYPTIPHEAYSESDAEEAAGLALQIVETCENIITRRRHFYMD